MNKQIILCIYTSLLICIVSCNSEQKDWNIAISENSIESYNDFINLHSESNYVKLAQDRIDSLVYINELNVAWANTKDSLSLVKLNAFLSSYPNSPYSQISNHLIDSISTKKAIDKLKLNNSLFDTLNYQNVFLIYDNIKSNEKELLIKILVEKQNLLNDTSKIIGKVESVQGNDLSKVLRPSNMLNENGYVSQAGENGNTFTVKYNGVLQGETLGSSLLYGTGRYLASTKETKMNLKGSYTIENYKNKIAYSTFYPNDKLYFTVGFFSSTEFRLPFGENTIIRVLGNVDNFFNDIKIHSDANYPLHVMIKNDNLQYILGKGDIIVGDKVYTF